MIILGLILLVIGLVAKIAILWTIGVILLVVGAVLWILGSMGRAVGGRVREPSTKILPRSFRGATEGGEPGIHSPRSVVMDSGLAASRRPGMTQHMIRISNR